MKQKTKRSLVRKFQGKFRRFWYHVREDWKFESYAVEVTNHREACKIQFSIRLVGKLFNLATCYFFGHKWESEDWATPNSGYMGMSCQRCGYEVGEYLY